MKRSTLIALAVFVALLAGVWFTLNRAPERGISRVSFTGADASTIDRVEIAGKNAVVLVKEGESWRVEGGKPADTNLVKRMVESIPKMQSSDLATTDSGRFAEMEVDDEKGAKVRALAGGKEIAAFVVGKGARGGSYVRVGDAVYVVAQVYAPTFSREASQWLEKKLFDDKLEEVTRVEVALAGQKPYALVKKDNNWELEDAKALPKGFRFDGGAARSLVSTLITARAKDLLATDPGGDKTQLAKGDAFAYVVETGTGDAKTTTRHELKLGAALEDKSIYGQVGGKADVVTVPEYTGKNLRKLPSEFRDLKMVELDQTKVTKLTISDGKLRLVLEKQGAEWKMQSSSEKLPADFQLDPGMVTRRISMLASARGASVAEVSAAAAGLGVASVSATLDDKKVVTVSFGKTVKENNQEMIYARGNADNAVYLVTKWTRDNLCGGFKSLQKSADEGGMANLDPKTLQGLPPDVRESLMKQLQQKKQQQALIERMQQQAGGPPPAPKPSAPQKAAPAPAKKAN